MSGKMHTPGPWEVRHRRNIAPVGRDALCVGVAEQHDKNHEANARLMAAAPDLLAALESAVLQIEYMHAKFGETGSGNGEIAHARAAIAKATGHE